MRGAKMGIFKTSLETIWASEEEVKIYYETATKKINLLLQKYNIRDIQGNLEKVLSDKLRDILSFTGFFESTPLKSIFFDQKQQFIPQEILYTFRNIISDPPINIKAIFFNTFITLLTKKGWDRALSAYFEKQYNFPPDGIIILDDLKDFSLGFGVYKATFQLRIPSREKIIVFLKKSYSLASYNEQLYFHLQKELLPTASYANLPYRLSNKGNEELLLSPLIPGVVSDTILSILTQAYKKTNHKVTLKKALVVLIEAFMEHAALGDLLLRNDRNLINSLVAPIIDGILQNNILEDLNNPEKILVYAKNIVANKTKAISLVDIDLKWLLEEKNSGWILADIDCGLSEINLLSLLPDFNNYNSKTNPFFEKRKEYIAHYFNIYCQKQKNILNKKEFLFSAIKKIYPSHISEKKLKLFTQRINFFEKNNKSIVELFKRYLLNFRIRLVYKETLIALDRISKKSNNKALLNALKKNKLLKFLPPKSTFVSYESSILLQLQCFRGVLSKKDSIILSEKVRINWEAVASIISMIAKKFNSRLFKVLEDKKQFIKKDTTALLTFLLSTSHS
jgi:hypothetical protein